MSPSKKRVVFESVYLLRTFIWHSLTLSTKLNAAVICNPLIVLLSHMMRILHYIGQMLKFYVTRQKFGGKWLLIDSKGQLLSRLHTWPGFKLKRDIVKALLIIAPPLSCQYFIDFDYLIQLGPTDLKLFERKELQKFWSIIILRWNKFRSSFSLHTRF